MKKLYLLLLRLSMISGLLLPACITMSVSAQTVVPDSSKVIRRPLLTDTRSDKPTVGVKLPFIPFKQEKDRFFGNISGIPIPKSIPLQDKVLNNVKVYPNPVKTDLNLTYSISKDAHITVRVMDILGNEVAVLLSERVNAGVQTNSFNIAARLHSGFYFIRVSVGSEIITKRISVL